MLSWLWYWITGACKHQYELVSQNEVEIQHYNRYSHEKMGPSRGAGTKFVLKCRKCGAMKSEIL